MTVPALSSISNTETRVSVVFSANVTSSTGEPGLGFTVLVNGVSRSIDDASISTTTVRLDVSGTIDDRDTVKVSYNATLGNLADLATGLDPVATFTTQTSTNSSSNAKLMAALIGVNGNNVVTLRFSKAITTAAAGTGLTFKVNDVTTAASGVAVGADPREIRATFTGAFSYSDDVTFSYASGTGDWDSGVAVASLTDVAVVNASTVGDPSSSYPLSNVIREKLDPTNGVVMATVGIDLNLVDVAILKRYGPVTVDFGGTFGVTGDNADGVFVAQNIKAISTGLKVTQAFTVASHPDWAADAATEWLTVMTQRIAAALGTARTTDQSVTLGSQTIAQV